MPHTFTYRDIVNINNAIARITLDGGKRPVKFNFALIANQRKCAAIIKDLQLAVDQSTPEFAQIEQGYEELKADYALRDDIKRLVIDPTNGKMVVDPSKSKDYDIACKELRRNTPGWDAIYKHRVETLERMYHEIVQDFQPHMVSINDFPSEMSTNDQSALAFMTLELQDQT